jgi:hypothetical protein
MHQSKITDFVNIKELSSGSESCQTTDEIGPYSELFDSKVGVNIEYNHRKK